ncbi:MAG: hypothetical protein Q4P23_03420 [Micrococcaceae bacterium]|nr:hypothetical protein [Micrococcaceae bacterium]
MATLKHKSGHTVTTSYAPEIVSLRAQGYADVPEVPTAEATEVIADPIADPTAGVPAVEAKTAGAVNKLKSTK